MVSKSVITNTLPPFFFRTENLKNSPILNAIKASAISDKKSIPLIIFEGTKSQWQAISKDTEWNKINGTLKPIKIICTDGQIN